METTFKIIEQPKIVGSYEITGDLMNRIEFNFCKKPKLINRLFCKWCLGWTWNDKQALPITVANMCRFYLEISKFIPTFV